MKWAFWSLRGGDPGMDRGLAGARPSERMKRQDAGAAHGLLGALRAWAAVLLLWFCQWPAVAQLPTPVSIGVMVDTNNMLLNPTNFFTANSNLLVQIVGTNSLFLTALTNALGTTATPTFGAAAGTYLNSVGIVLSCATPNSTITYTTDGSTPSATNGVVYTNSFTLSSAATVKAFATSYYRPDSAVASRSYTISSGTRVYYGRSANTSLTGAQVEALGYTTKTSGINGSYNFVAGAGYYYFAWVQAFDSPVDTTGFVINAIPVTMADSLVGYSGSSDNGWTYQTASNGGNTYKVFRSAYPLTGANTVVLTGSNGLP